mgnify:CR=1 FL=1
MSFKINELIVFDEMKFNFRDKILHFAKHLSYNFFLKLNVSVIISFRSSIESFVDYFAIL